MVDSINLKICNIYSSIYQMVDFTLGYMNLVRNLCKLRRFKINQKFDTMI